MGWLSDKFALRSLENPRIPLSAASEWLPGGRISVTGAPVTAQTSLEIPAIWSAVRTISSTIATLPLPVFRYVDGGKVKAKEHHNYTLLHDRPNPELSSFAFRELMQGWLLLLGSAFAEIERNGRGEPIALWPLSPEHVRIVRLDRQKLYVVRVDGKEVPLAAENVLHIPGFSLDGHNGLIPVSLFRNTVAHSAALAEHGARFFANSAAPSGILSHPAKLGPEGAKALREAWNKSHAGLSQSQRVAILEEGMTFSPLSLPNDVSQFIESRKFSVSDVARLFLLPPHMLGDLEAISYASVEQSAIAYVTHCIEPWTRRIEQEINYKLFSDRSHFAEFQLQGLLRGDSAARSAYYRELVNIGAMTINEVRAFENLNAIAGGDTPRVALNTAPITGSPANV